MGEWADEREERGGGGAREMQAYRSNGVSVYRGTARIKEKRNLQQSVRFTGGAV
jgi:hypothetical protein